MNTSNNHTRAIQQDAKAWARFTGSTYTSALRQMKRAVAQGLIGERLSARRLIDVLQNHPMIGADGSYAVLGEHGYYSDDPFVFNGKTDYLELAMIAEVLRMLTPAEPVVAGESSYALKHTAERFLAPHHSYISNGRIIWVAAALGLPLAAPQEGGLSLLIGVSERGHDYVRRMMGPDDGKPRAHQHRPVGFERLQDALRRYDTDEPFGPWTPTPGVVVDSPFDTWLSQQAGRRDPVGDVARDYVAGVRDGDHEIVGSGVELLELLPRLEASTHAMEAAGMIFAEWDQLQKA